jgi:hypothetical protein
VRGILKKIDEVDSIMPGWNYTQRLYRLRLGLLDGSWKIPAPVPAS